MAKYGIALALCGLLTGAAVADPLTEIEPNDTPETAMFIDESFYPFGAVAIDGSVCIEDGDPVDYFSFDLLAGDVITASAFSLTVGGDPYLELLGPAPGYPLVIANDSAFGLNPFFGVTIPADGTYAIGVSNGASSDECFDYKFAFAINPIPEPGTLGVMALAGLGLIVRRSR